MFCELIFKGKLEDVTVLSKVIPHALRVGLVLGSQCGPQEVHSPSALLWISHTVPEIGQAAQELTVLTKPSSIPPPESQKTRLQSHSLEPDFHTAVNSPLLLSDSYSTEYLMLEKNPKLKLHFPIFFQ